MGKLSTMNNILDIFLSQLLKMLERRLPLQPCIKKEVCPPSTAFFLVFLMYTIYRASLHDVIYR